MADLEFEIKSLQNIVQGQAQSMKNMESSLERLRSVEQLLERVAGSNEEMLKHFQQMFQMYQEAMSNRRT